jgi:hypothetical protein
MKLSSITSSCSFYRIIKPDVQDKVSWMVVLLVYILVLRRPHSTSLGVLNSLHTDTVVTIAKHA